MFPSFDLSPQENNLEASLAYLIGARDYIAQQTPPAGYYQIPHSDDLYPVGGNKKCPALLDASYEHFGRFRLSVSFPSFIPQDKPYEFTKDPKPGEAIIRYLPGFNNIAIQTSFLQLLKSQNIKFDGGSSKCGYYEPNGTHYIEVIVEPADYAKGRALIHQLVHGNANTDAELYRLIQPSHEKHAKPRSVWEKARSFTTRILDFRPSAKQPTGYERKAGL